MSRTSTPPISNEPPLPPRERGTGRAILLALLMHALLALLLYHGVQWPNSTPAGADAELWSDVPDVTTPPPPAPPTPVVAPPPVPDEQADIALQQQKQREAQARQAALDAARQARLEAQRQADAKRAAALAAAAAAADAARQAEQQKAADRQRQQAQEELKQLQQRQKQQEQQKQLEQQKLAEQAAQRKAAADKAAAAKAAAAKARAAQAAANAQLNNERASRLAQLQGMANGEGLSNAGSGNGSGGNAASPGYPDKVRRVVKPNINYGGSTDGLTTVVMVHCAPSGTVLSVSVVRHSSNPVWDSAVVDAVRASSPLPPDVDGQTPGNIRITFHAAEGG